MKTDIFIKTCNKDLCWLKHCLESIRRYATGFNQLIIVMDADCDPVVVNSLPDAGQNYFNVDQWSNGYIHQQFVKMSAAEYSKADQILFVDSDCVFFTQFSPESFMKNEKPILMKTRYGTLGDGDAWQAVTENFCGWPVEFEYMRRLPLMYTHEAISKARANFPDLELRLRGITSRSFSEFNVIGAYIARFMPDTHFIVDTADWIPDAVARQFWSWGGISDDIQKEIDVYLYRQAKNES